MSPKTCPICQTVIPENAPGGFCPACLLRDAGEPRLTGRGAPALEEIAGAFPQLEILELIGQGGMGFVYKARQSHLDRTVALKILAPELQRDPSFAERFAREARALGKLRHPNIVTLHEHGESGGFFYLLMEYVDGVNLRQAMATGRFTPEHAFAVVPPICDALQSAHAQGVWHRDTKPENILLDRDGRVKIADFGIARIAGDAERNFTLTLTGNTLGSAAYMAPEQHENPRHVDHRADIYSLGVVIYEMLTGELPLGRFPAPSQRAEVNARIDEIVLRTLEKERELRQQSAEEVKTEVTSVGSHTASSRGQNGPSIPPASRKRRLMKAIFLTGAVLLALAGAAFLWETTLSKRREEAAYEAMTEELKLKAVIDLGSWETALLAMKEPKRNYALGPVIEQAIPKPAKGVACLLDFESGRLLNPPDSLGEMLSRGDASFAAPKGSEDGVSITRSRFESLSMNGIDALATMPDGNSLRLFRSLAFPLSGSFDKISSDDVLKRLERGIARHEGAQLLQNSYTQRAFISLPAPAGIAFAFISAKPYYGAAVTGVMQITGTQQAPEGAKIRYRLIERLPDNSPLAAGNAKDAQAGLPLSLEVRPNDSELLQKRSNAEVIAVGLKNPRGHAIAWDVLRKRAEAGQFSQAEAGELMEKLTSWLRREHPHGFWDTLVWPGGFLQELREQNLISDGQALDFLQAFYAGIRVDAFPRIREGATVKLNAHLRNIWHDDLLGFRLLSEMRSITVDGRRIELKHPYGREGHSGWTEEYETELLVPGFLPGKHRVRCEIDSALVAVADCGGMEPNDLPAKWRATKRRWQRTNESDLMIYTKDAELVKLSYDPALNPLEPAKLSAKPVIIRPGKEGLMAAVSLNAEKREGVSYSVKVTLKLGGKTFLCGSFWSDGKKERGSENSSGRLTFAVDIGALDSETTDAEIVLSPDPKGIEASPGVDRIWGRDIVFEHVPLERLDGTDPSAAIEARLRQKYGPGYLTWSPALEALLNARLIQVASENPTDADSIWGILKKRLEEEKLGAIEANDLMAKLTEWLRRIQPDGYEKQQLLIMEEFLFALHQRHLVLEPQTIAYLRALHGDGEVTAQNYRHDQTVRFGCGMGGGWHRDVWFGFRLLREFRSMTIDGKPVEVRGSKRPGMMNGAGFSGEFNIEGLPPGKHNVSFQIRSALVAEQDAAGLPDDAPSADWPPAKSRWDGNLEAELIIPAEAPNSGGKPNEPVLTPLKAKPQGQPDWGEQSSKEKETPEAMEELLKTARYRNGRVFVSRFSRSIKEMRKKESRDLSQNLCDFGRVRLVEAKCSSATTRRWSLSPATRPRPSSRSFCG